MLIDQGAKIDWTRPVSRTGTDPHTTGLRFAHATDTYQSVQRRVLLGPMRIGILGPLTITDAKDVPLVLNLEPKQTIALLAIAANADRGIPLHELVVAVYGSTEALLYKRSTESLVSRLRATLRKSASTSAEVLPAAKGGFYGVNLGEHQIDALRFLRTAEHLLNNWNTILPSERRLLARKALGEWREDPVRIYAGICPVAPELLRRFTSNLTELGHQYVRLLLEERCYDEAKRELGRLNELLPANAEFKHLQEKVGLHGAQTAPLLLAAQSSEIGARAAMEELGDRLHSSQSRPCDVITVTAHNLDKIYPVERVAPDHEVTIDVPLEAPGGSGANTIAALGRLGCAVAAAGIVADDAEGRSLRDSLTAARVDCGNVLIVPARRGKVRTGYSIIFSDPSGVRSIYVHPGVNESFAKELSASPRGVKILRNSIRRSRIVHFTSFTSPAELSLQESLTSVLQPEAILSLNPGALYASLGLDRLDPILSRANILLVYEQNLRELVDNSAAPSREIGESGVRCDLERLYAWKGMKGYDQPLVTLVKRYQSAVSQEREAGYLTIASGRSGIEEVVGTQARIAVKNELPVKDSTGAGDAMAAGLHFGLLHGSSLRECADLSFLLATMVSDHIGARDGQPALNQLRLGWRAYFPGVAEPQCLEESSFNPPGSSGDGAGVVAAAEALTTGSDKRM